MNRVGIWVSLGDMTEDSPDLEQAYSIETPDDSRKLYAQWADDYDNGFARAQRYLLPDVTARIFAEAGGIGPVLDVGAGTGLCGAALVALGVEPVDATDISAEMLNRAAQKDIYRDTIEADLLEGLPVPPGTYAGIVSSGTFTTGHVGPDGIDPLLRVAQNGALFALSINAKHYECAGFADKLDALGGAITDLSLVETRIYGPDAEGPHKDDIAYVALFRKA